MKAVAGTLVRPTADRVREALFSRLQARYGLAGSHVCDLYAGTGALGIEALSRGAESAVFVEKAPAAVACLRENLAALGIDGAGRIEAVGVTAAVARWRRDERRFCGVFADPPYGQRLVAALMQQGGVAEIIRLGGWFVAETERAAALPERAGALVKVREDCYGDTKLWLYEAEADESV